MMLFATKPRPFTAWYTKEQCYDRWALFVEDGYVSIERQVKNSKSERFSLQGKYFCLSFTKSFAIGSSHVWYDGTHCGIHLGFVNLSWAGVRCKKCENGDKTWIWPPLE